jgi:hypothetical protein
MANVAWAGDAMPRPNVPIVDAALPEQTGDGPCGARGHHIW